MGALKILSNKRVNRWPWKDHEEGWKLDPVHRKPNRTIGPTRGFGEFKSKPPNPVKFYEQKYGITVGAEGYLALFNMTRAERRRVCLGLKRTAKWR